MNHRPRNLSTAAAVLGLLVLGACSSTPKSAPVVAASAASVDAARSSGAPELAPAELDQARAKLERAQALSKAGDNQAAARLAAEADVDAQLARAKSGAERSRRAVAEVEASLAALRIELQRRP